MSRRFVVALSVAWVLSVVGCRNMCGERGCLTSSGRLTSAPGRLLGGSRLPAEGCYDAITGEPVPCPPAAAVVPGGSYPAPAGLVPGSSSPPRPDELPFPSPGDMIPRPDVPFAPPRPAPGNGTARPTAEPPPARPAGKP